MPSKSADNLSFPLALAAGLLHPLLVLWCGIFRLDPIASPALYLGHTRIVVAKRNLFVLLACLFLLYILMNSASAQPRAANGVLDLSAVDMAESGSLRLDGDWEFYPGQLLSPEAFSKSSPSVPADQLALPGSWNGFLKDGRTLEGSGVATFRLQIFLPRHQGYLALRVFDVRSAYRLWANGKLVSARGVVSDSAETERDDPSLDMPILYSDATSMELVLEISNHHYRDGGVTSSILLSTADVIRNSQSQRWALALFFVGGMLVMGCYHVLYWSFRRSLMAPLYFGLYCLLWMGNYMASNSSDWVLLLFVPHASVAVLERINTVCLFLSIPVGYLFFSALFENQFSVRILKVTWVFFGVFALLALTVPMITLQTLVPYSYLAAISLIVYCLFRLFNASRQHRDGASYILIGFGVLGLIAINDMLNDLQMIHTVYLIPFGMFFFILAQGFSFSLSLSQTFSEVERLSCDLEERNRALELEGVERARLEREIVNISENERRCLSLDLHDGLCQELTAARLRCSVLERKLGENWPGDTELAQLSRLLDNSVNHAYELSRGLWPLDHDQQGMSTFLEDFCRRLAVSSGIAIKVLNLRACGVFPKDNAIHLYRIAQEAINNAVRHAGASLIEVSLDCASHPGMLSLCIRDDGVGVGNASAATSQGGLGLRIMAHRARMIGGIFSIEDGEEGGTIVTCRVWCEQCTRNSAAG